MKQEILERLFVDQAMGGLSPDVDALLKAYIDKAPAEERLQREIADTVLVAKRALPKPAALALPPLKVAVLAERAALKRRRTWWPAELAAVFIVGLSLGPWLWSLHPGTQARNTPVAPANTGTATTAPSSSGFWSLARLTGEETKSPAFSRPRVSWISPVRKPKLNP